MFLSEEKNVSAGTINSGNDTPTGKYTLEYMRKPVSIPVEKPYSRQLSDTTLTTQVSLSESPQSLHLTTLKADGSVISVNQTILKPSPVNSIPAPFFLEQSSNKLRKLDSGIYVGAVSDDEESEYTPPPPPSPSADPTRVQTVIEFDGIPTK